MIPGLSEAVGRAMALRMAQEASGRKAQVQDDTRQRRYLAWAFPLHGGTRLRVTRLLTLVTLTGRR